MTALWAAIGEIVTWLLSSLISEARKPTRGVELAGAAEDPAAYSRELEAYRSFSGVSLR